MHFTILTDKPISQEARLLKILKSAGSKGVANYDFPKARILATNRSQIIRLAIIQYLDGENLWDV